MQTKLGSITESVLNVLSGLLISFFTWTLIVAPIWGFDLPVLEIFSINVIFTVISIARGYLWRRLFNYFTIRSYHESNTRAL